MSEDHQVARVSTSPPNSITTITTTNNNNNRHHPPSHGVDAGGGSGANARKKPYSKIENVATGVSMVLGDLFDDECNERVAIGLILTVADMGKRIPVAQKSLCAAFTFLDLMGILERKEKLHGWITPYMYKGRAHLEEKFNTLRGTALDYKNYFDGATISADVDPDNEHKKGKNPGTETPSRSSIVKSEWGIPPCSKPVKRITMHGLLFSFIQYLMASPTIVSLDDTASRMTKLAKKEGYNAKIPAAEVVNQHLIEFAQGLIALGLVGDATSSTTGLVRKVSRPPEKLVWIGDGDAHDGEANEEAKQYLGTKMRCVDIPWDYDQAEGPPVRDPRSKFPVNPVIKRRWSTGSTLGMSGMAMARRVHHRAKKVRVRDDERG